MLWFFLLERSYSNQGLRILSASLASGDTDMTAWEGEKKIACLLSGDIQDFLPSDACASLKHSMVAASFPSC